MGQRLPDENRTMKYKKKKNFSTENEIKNFKKIFLLNALICIAYTDLGLNFILFHFI